MSSGDLIIPRLPAFLAADPLLEVGIDTTDHRVDPVLEGFDCVLRSLDDLAHHRLIHYAGKLNLQGAGWEYRDGEKTRVQPMRSSLVVNGTDA